MKDICVKWFPDSVDAELAKSMLLANGIKSAVEIQGTHLASGVPSSVGAAKLFVLEKDFEKAKEIMGGSVG